MRNGASDGWNAAQRAQERKLEKPRKMHGPVGDENANLLRGPHDVHCKGCGYYKCSCSHLFSVNTPSRAYPTWAELCEQLEAIRATGDWGSKEQALALLGLGEQAETKLMTADEAAEFCKRTGRAVRQEENLSKLMWRWHEKLQQFEHKLQGHNRDYWTHARHFPYARHTYGGKAKYVAV